MTKLKEPIAIVKLGHGEIGYFDKLTRLRLTRKAPYGRIYDDMDLKNIRRSVKVGRLILVNGMLPAENANYSKATKRFIPSSNYDMVASGLIRPEELEFDLDAALAEAKENLEKVNKENTNGLQEKGQEGLQVVPETKTEEVKPEETPKAEVVPEETEAKDVAEETVEEESTEEVEDEATTEDKPKKTRGRKKASK